MNEHIAKLRETHRKRIGKQPMTDKELKRREVARASGAKTGHYNTILFGRGRR